MTHYLIIGPIDCDDFTAEDRKEWLEDAGWKNVTAITDQNDCEAVQYLIDRKKKIEEVGSNGN